MKIILEIHTGILCNSYILLLCVTTRYFPQNVTEKKNTDLLSRMSKASIHILFFKFLKKKKHLKECKGLFYF